jgi:hypothetical protein
MIYESNSIQESPFCEDDGHSAIKFSAFNRTGWFVKVYRAHNCQPINPILSQMNPDPNILFL